MTQRKPDDISWESWVDRLIRGDSDAVVTGEIDEEILEQAVPHAEQAHGLEDSEELRGQLRGAIGDA